jgi:hypothetical protein
MFNICLHAPKFGQLFTLYILYIFKRKIYRERIFMNINGLPFQYLLGLQSGQTGSLTGNNYADSLGLQNYNYMTPTFGQASSSNTAGSSFMQTSLQMYQSGMMDKKTLLLMGLASGMKSTDALGLMYMLQANDAQASLVEKQLKDKIASRNNKTTFTSTDLTKIGDGSTSTDATVSDDNGGSSSASESTAATDTTEVTDETEKTEKTDAKSAKSQERGDAGDDDISNAIFSGTAASTTSYNLGRKFVNYKQTKNKGISTVDKRQAFKQDKTFSKNVKAADDASLKFDIEKNPRKASEWLENVKKTDKHFTNIRPEGYTIEQLKALKPEELAEIAKTHPEVKQFAEKVKEAERISHNIKVADARDASANKVTESEKRIKDLESQKSNTKSSARKQVLEKQIKEEKVNLKKCNEDFAKKAKAFEKVAREQHSLDLAASKDYKANVEKLQKQFKGESPVRIKKLCKAALEDAEKTGNTKMAKLYKDVLAKCGEKGANSKTVAKLLETTTKEAGVEISTLTKAGKNLSKLAECRSAVGKVMGKAAIPLAIALEGIDVYGAYKKSTKEGNKQLIKSSSGLLASIGASAAAGALVGTVVPGAGNVVGFIVGAIAGIGGYYLGSKAGGAIADKVVT